MRAKLLLVSIVLFFAASLMAAEQVDLGTSYKGLNVEVLESNSQRTVIKYDLGSYYQEEVNIDGSQYFNIKLPDEGFLMNAGAPELPYICRSIIIPDDAQMEVNIISSEYVDIKDIAVMPSKGNLLRNVNPDDVPYMFGDVYNEDAFYPAKLTSLREPFILRDYRGTVVELNALQYNAVQKTLRVYTSVTLEIANVGPGQINVLQNAKRSTVVPEFRQIYERRFINFGFQAEKYTMLDEAGELLIITYDAFESYMQPLVDWKMQKGIKTTMVNKTTSGSTSTAIKSYIQSFYTANPDLAYVLLVGDAAQMPTMTASGGSSDPSYGKLVGSDDYPDIVIGRFSAETTGDVETQVARTITYEQSPIGSDWFHKATGVASAQGTGTGHYGEADSTHMNYIRNDLLAFTYTEVDKVYDYYGTAAMITSALNEGRGFANYCGHGTTTSWSSTGFSNTNVNALTNDNMLPFIVSVACVNGQFSGYTCFAEAWMRATNGTAPTGAIATFMSSIDQSWAPPMYAQDEVTDLLIAETRTSFGALCYSGAAYMVEMSSDVDMINTWHVFGDPSVQVRTDNPTSMTVNYNPAVFFNVTNYSVEVVGVQGALCALYADGVLYGSAYTDAGGIADITLNENLPIGGEVTLTVTAFNKATFTGTVQAASDLAIVHTPLTDTKDTLNNYEINCTVYSSDDITTDGVVLHYDVGGGYIDVIMAEQKIIQADYQGYIPVQSAGTTVNYYITASNLSNFYDTTDIYSFDVIDYQMILEPAENSITAPVYDTAWYDMRLTNDGVLADDYALSVSGDEWTTQIRDAAGTSVITSSGTLVGDQEFQFKVMVVVPESLEGAYDEIQLTATSTGDPSLYAFSTLTTVSAGQPWPIPFTETFPTTSFDMTKWESVGDAEINTTGIDEPSSPYSCNLDGQSTGGEAIQTEKINLKDESNIIVKYYYQQTGDGESPDTDDDLTVEYLNDSDTWVVLNTHLGSGADMTEFEEVELTLPTDAMHAGFRLQFSCTATTGDYDDWFVDDIYVGHPSDFDVRINPSSQSEYGPAGDTAVYTLTIINKGFLEDNFTLTYDGSWDVVFFDEALSGEITATGIVPGGDSINVIVKVAVPDGTPLHTANTSTVWATSQGDSIMKAYALVETISAGSPADIPWYETFPADTLFTERWFTFVGATITSLAPNTPSTPYSYNLDGGCDTIITQLIDLSSQSGVLLSYYYESGGGYDIPESGDNLWIDYRNNSGTWTNLATHTGGTNMTEFEYVSVELPVDACHSSLQIRFRTYGSASGEDNWYLDNIRLDYPPEMALNYTAFSENLIQGDSVTRDLIINNSGQGGLLYELSLVPHVRTDGIVTDYPDYVYADVEKGVDIDYQDTPLTRSQGGPDDYGYYWVDSDDPNGPVFEWIDISSTGTDYIGDLDDDNYVGPISIGFDFVFYGVSYDEVYIGSNGIMGFLESTMDARTSRPIPYSSSPNALLSLVWDDLDPTDADNTNAHVYAGSSGDNFVIQIVDYPEYRADAGDVITAEIILYPNGRIRYQYKTIAAGFDVTYCTVGIENHDGNMGTQVVYHQSYLKDNLAIEFFKPYDWLVLDKTEGEVSPGEADTVKCLFRTIEELDPGNYTTDIIIDCNDPDMDPTTIQADLEVTERILYVCGDADGNDLVNISDAVYIINYIFISGTAPDPLEAADCNCDSVVNVSDAVKLINYIFMGGDVPCDIDGDSNPDC